jgi:hypothetical protein
MRKPFLIGAGKTNAGGKSRLLFYYFIISSQYIVHGFRTLVLERDDDGISDNAPTVWLMPFLPLTPSSERWRRCQRLSRAFPVGVSAEALLGVVSTATDELTPPLSSHI